MPISTRTLEERVALYAREATQDPTSLEAMAIVLRTLSEPQLHYERIAFESTHQRPARAPASKSGLTEAVRAATQGARGNIIVHAIVKKLERSNFPFTSPNHPKSVAEALQRLAEKEELEIVRKGKGGKPNIYRLPKPKTGAAE